MLDDRPAEQSIERLAKNNLTLACERARECVAAAPSDEASAILLRDLVGKLAAEQPRDSVTADLVDAAPDVRKAASLLEKGEEEQAEVLLREHLAAHRNDPAAMRLMAQIAAKCGFLDNAERIARRALEIHPDSVGIRLTLARILFFHTSERDGATAIDRALDLVDEAITLDPSAPAPLVAKATFLLKLREQTEALALFDQALRLDPLDPVTWLAAGGVRRNLGQAGLAVAAFRTASALDPSLSRAWIELSNLKTIKLFPSDTPLIEEALELDQDVDDNQRAELHFSLFKAYDDGGNLEAAATHLAKGNAIKRRLHHYDSAIVTADVDRSIETFTRDFFSREDSGGSNSDEIIFIVGMYRAGSTLVEQILSSHSQIEGTEELPYVLQAAAQIHAAKPGLTPEEFVCSAAPEQIEGMAGVLLNLSRRHKRSSKPYFIDKNPANWRFIGLIHTLLPNARIIDVRRNPLDCCFANYAQHYGAGVAFSYDQRDLARYYADCVRLMRHFEGLLPGRYHRVIYEDLVDAPEAEIERLLDFLGLAFEESCLRFFETERPVYTPSAQQVRQPINRSGLDRWRPYEAWLQPLIDELGDLPQTFRN